MNTDNTDKLPVSKYDIKQVPRYSRVRVDGKSAMEHRAIMENILGHKIPDGYVVHHKDHNVRNNDPANLVLLTEEEHQKLHQEERIQQKHKCIPVRSCDEHGNTIKVYPSIAATAEDGYNPRLVDACLHGRQETHHGAHWDFASDKRPTRKNRAVCAIDPYTRKIETYKNAVEACEKTGANSFRLGEVLKGRVAVMRYLDKIWWYEDTPIDLDARIQACKDYDATRRRPVRCYDTHTGLFIAEYPDAITAAECVKYGDTSRINLCCNGKVASNAGYIWRWADDTTPVVPIMKYIAAIDPKTNKIIEVFRTKAATQIIGGYDQRNVGRCCRSQTAVHKGLRWREIEPEELPTDLPEDKMHLAFTYSNAHVV